MDRLILYGVYFKPSPRTEMIVGTGRIHPAQPAEKTFQETMRHRGRSNLKKDKDGTTFLLTVINVFSKVSWCIPLKNKLVESLVAALEGLITNVVSWPTTLQTDKGLEFLNRSVQVC